MNEQQQPAPLSEEQLQLIRERVERIATPGPYHVGFANDAEIGDHWYVSNNEMPYHATLAEVYEEGDAQFFLHSLTDIPALLAEVERVKEQRNAFRDAADKEHARAYGLEMQNAAMRELVLAATQVNSMSEWNLAGLADKARAILASGAAESEGV